MATSSQRRFGSDLGRISAPQPSPVPQPSLVEPWGRASASSRSALAAASEFSPVDAPPATSSAAGTHPPAVSEPPELIRVLLADDHVMVRTGICSLLQLMDDVEVVGQASSGHEALRLLQARQHQAEVLGLDAQRPATDIAILDISMANMNGLEAAAHIASLYPETRVLMLSMHDSEEYVLQALRVGASGYLLKESSANELELAVRTVASGAMYLSPGVSRHSRHVVAAYFQSQMGQPEPKAEAPSLADVSKSTSNTASTFTSTPAPPKETSANEPATLTRRQQEILRLLAQGFSNGQIAKKLSISIKTVESHRAQLMSRLNIFDIASLVRYAIRHGFVDPS